MRRRILLLALLAMSAIACFTGIVAFAGWQLARPARAWIGPPPADLPAEEVTLRAATGARLAGWFIPGRPGAGAVLLLHGVRGNRLHMVDRARLLAAEGFAVLLLDLQAHGESSGARITFGRDESSDATAAVAWLRARLPGERIGVIGISLGGAATLLGPAPLPVQAMVLESVYADIDSAIANRLRAYLPTPAATVIAAMFRVLMRPVLGIRREELRPVLRIGAVTAPILVASGTADDRTPLVEAEALFAAAPAPKRFWPVAGARHEDLERLNPAGYRAEVLGFLLATLRP
jgi:uncharacterized protein